jgi:predicted amidophosphoribosyltransferase
MMIDIVGSWKKGYAFSIHTLKSEHIGDDQYGRPRFNTTRSPMGQCLYEVKYHQDTSSVNRIIDLLSKDDDFRKFVESIDVILPVPPSNKNRRWQPVILVAQEIARIFRKDMRQDILASSNSEEVKNLDTEEKYDRIKKSIAVEKLLDKSQKILIFDDVFDSGSTLLAISDALIENGYENIFVFALTKTRVAD